MDEILKWVAKVPAKRKLLITDSCHSGALGTAGIAKGPNQVNSFLKGLAQSYEGLVVLTSSEGYQLSQIYKEKEHSYFTYFLLRALREDASQVDGSITGNRDGKVDPREAYEWVRTQVKQATRNQQIPDKAGDLGINIPLAIVKEMIVQNDWEAALAQEMWAEAQRKTELTKPPTPSLPGRFESPLSPPHDAMDTYARLDMRRGAFEGPRLRVPGLSTRSYTAPTTEDTTDDEISYYPIQTEISRGTLKWTPLVLGNPVKGTLNKPDALNWYRIDVTAGDYIHINMTKLTDDCDLKLYGSSGDLVSISQNGGLLDEDIAGIVKHSVYYASVFAYGGKTCGYEIRLLK